MTDCIILQKLILSWMVYIFLFKNFWISQPILRQILPTLIVLKLRITNVSFMINAVPRLTNSLISMWVFIKMNLSLSNQTSISLTEKTNQVVMNVLSLLSGILRIPINTYSEMYSSIIIMSWWTMKIQESVSTDK